MVTSTSSTFVTCGDTFFDITMWSAIIRRTRSISFISTPEVLIGADDWGVAVEATDCTAGTGDDFGFAEAAGIIADGAFAVEVMPIVAGFGSLTSPLFFLSI